MAEKKRRHPIVMTSELFEKAIELEKHISIFLSNKLTISKKFPGRTFYGEAFYSLCLAGEHKNKNLCEDLLWNAINNGPEHTDFHWEFVLLSILKYNKMANNNFLRSRILDKHGKLKFKGTNAINWFLMRQLCILLASPCRAGEVSRSVKSVLSKFKINDAEVFFEDQKNDHSHQYHAYIIALLVEINNFLNEQEITDWIVCGTNYLARRQFYNGCVMYRGRGQEQIFGYGCYLFILAYVFKITNDAYYLKKYKAVLLYVDGFKNSKLGLPLCLNKLQKKIPIVVDLKKTDYSGWYTYNNHYDYLPFFLYYLKESKEQLSGSDCTELEFSNSISKVYELRFEPGTKLWSNDISFPLIYDIKKDIFITSIQGGEQYSPSLNSGKDLVFPYIRRLNHALWHSSFLIFSTKKILVYLSPFGIIIRRVVRRENYVTIDTRIISPIKMCIPILISHKFSKSLDLSDYTFDGYAYTPFGKFSRYFTRSRFQSLIISFEP